MPKDAIDVSLHVAKYLYGEISFGTYIVFICVSSLSMQSY